MNTAFSNQSSIRSLPLAVAHQPWLLLGLACAAGLLLFHTTVTDVQSGRLVCGTVLLHILPGVAVAHFFKRRDPLETAVFGLALSPLVVTLLVYICCYFLRLPLWVTIAVGGALLTAILALFPRNGETKAKHFFEWPAALPLGASLLLILLTVAHYLQRPSNMLTIHGLFHTSGINQIMAGLIPPDNTHLYDSSP